MVIAVVGRQPWSVVFVGVTGEDEMARRAGGSAPALLAGMERGCVHRRILNRLSPSHSAVTWIWRVGVGAMAGVSEFGGGYPVYVGVGGEIPQPRAASTAP